MNFLKKGLLFLLVLVIWAEVNSVYTYEKMLKDNIISIDRINLKYGDIKTKNYLEKLYIKNDIVIQRAIVVFNENENPLKHIFGGKEETSSAAK